MFEYRFYECTPGRLTEEVARMAEVATDPWPGGNGESLFDRFGIPRPLAAWTSIAGRRQPVFGYLLEWKSLDERDRAFPAFWASPEWAEVKARTEGGYPLVDAIENWLIAPNASWDRSGGFDDQVHGGMHEMRIHHILAGFGPQVTDYLREIEHRQIEVMGGRILGAFDVLIGPDMPAIVSYIAWPDFATQQRAADRIDHEPRVHERRHKWMAEYGRYPIRHIEQTLLRPLDFGLPKSNFGIAA